MKHVLYKAVPESSSIRIQTQTARAKYGRYEGLCGCLEAIQRFARGSCSWAFLQPQLLLKSRKFLHRDLLLLVEYLGDAFNFFNLFLKSAGCIEPSSVLKHLHSA